MAKKLTWKRTDSILSPGYMAEGKHQPFASFDLTDIFSDFAKLNEVQQTMIEYGAKQKLADACARSKDMKLTQDEMVAQMNETWELLKSGQWNKTKVGLTAEERAKKELEHAETHYAAALDEAKKLGMKHADAKKLADKLFGSLLEAAKTKIANLNK